MNNVAIIPARGGSKRIPRKNLKPFAGVPMIARSIRVALECGLFSRVVVSTDDEEIAGLARDCGAQVPFMRPAELADDFTGTAAVIAHALQALREQGDDFDRACCIYATAPLLQSRFLAQGLSLLEQHPDKSFAFSVCDFGFPVQRALTLDEQGALTALYPQYRDTRSRICRALIRTPGSSTGGAAMPGCGARCCIHRTACRSSCRGIWCRTSTHRRTGLARSTCMPR